MLDAFDYFAPLISLLLMEQQCVDAEFACPVDGLLQKLLEFDMSWFTFNLVNE